jgi:glycosyltransferase involved in cell wall biosynthesis
LAAADVVHGPSPASVPPPGEGQRLVVTVHDLAFRIYPSLFPQAWRNLFRLGLRRVAKSAAAVLVPSESTARDLTRLTSIDGRRVHVVPLAASLPQAGEDPQTVLRRMKVPRPYVLFVGTLEPRKNVVRLVRAYRRAVAASAVPHALVLAGPLGWQTQALHRELALRGPGHVVLTGRATPDQLDALYRGADAFAYPSLYEGFGLPVLEAMARGVPTIVSGTSSLPEVTGGAALAVDPRSVAELAGGLEQVLTDPREGRRLGETGRKRAGAFSWERTARETLAVYETVL